MSSLIAGLNSASNAIQSGLDSLLGRTSEESRQLAADDSRFCKPSLISFFELQTPTGNFLMPLVYAPQQMTVSEPYMVTPTPTLDGGLYVEEGGVVMRRITISGNTGFRPYDLNLPLPLPLRSSLLPKNYSDRGLQKMAFNALSGPRHYEYIAEVFRIYSDLRRDPTTAKDTRLCFHVPRNADHWQVAPLTFNTSQTAANPLTYPYGIEMLILGPAQPQAFPLATTDKNFLAQLRDTLATVDQAVSGMRAAVQDLTAVQGSFRQLGYQVNGIIANATSVIAAADNFVQGTEALINIPLGTVSSLFNLIEQTVALYVDTLDTVTAPTRWPNSIVSRFRIMQAACVDLLTQSEAFSPPLSAQLDAAASVPTAASVARTTITPTSFADITNAGTALLPGDATLMALNPAPAEQPNWLSIQEVVVRQGDTLAALAQRTLGSALYWRVIATLNDLQPPLTGANGRVFTDIDSLRDARGILVAGAKLKVPSTQPPPSTIRNPAVLGAKATAPLDEQALGRDLLLAPRVAGDGRVRYGLSIVDDGQGGQDLATVAGPDNLRQGLVGQVSTTKGTNVMYPAVGLDAVVGTGLFAADLEQLRYRVNQALIQDARVVSVAALTVDVFADQVVAQAVVDAAAGQGQVAVATVLP